MSTNAFAFSSSTILVRFAQNDTFIKAAMKAAGFSTFVIKDCAHTLPDVIATITGRFIKKDYPLGGTA